MSAEIADELRACAARIDADGTASQIVSADELRELAAMAEAGGWQPIETAPKDGSLLLLSCVGWPAAKVRGDPWPVKVGGFWEYRWNIFGASWQPTHWQPLPAPPSSLPNKEDRNG